MPARRSHRKSRLGCLQCKRRRIKCDETPPPCSNCKKHNIECQYAILPPAKQPAASRSVADTTVHERTQRPDSSSNRNHTPIVSTTAPSLNAAYPSPGPVNTSVVPSPMSVDQLAIFDSAKGPITQLDLDLNMYDLELMHHYATQTYQTMANTADHKELWRTEVPKEAIAHPFLMHGLLALAALHLADLSQNGDEARRRKYTELATAHQNVALAKFRPQLNNITSSNCHAVFAFSSLIAALAFAFSRSTANLRKGEPVTEVIEDIFLFRGVEGVLASHWETIQAGKLGSLIFRARDPSYFQPLSRDVIDALDRLHECNGKNVTHISEEEKDAYNHAIRELRISFQRSPASLESVFRWPIILPESYLALLKNRKPMALVILAHYCVILEGLDAYWWAAGWSGHLFEAIYRSLDESWRPLLQWPMQMIGLSLKLAKVT
ncbi:hypothetical protein VTO42DRAFT_3064 [Malbranchea cinnamomea]